MEGYEFCYWHLPDTGKYSSTVLEKYFGKEITLADALEKEVASGHALGKRFFTGLPFWRKLSEKGPKFNGSQIHGANLRGAWMSESNPALLPPLPIQLRIMLVLRTRT